jgi:hypothetical protein
MSNESYILDRFVPALNRVLYDSAPSLFIAYLGSACRQTAIMVAYELSQRVPDVKWQVFEGLFTGAPLGRKQQYDHAWVWGSCGLFIDANHRREHRIWEITDSNTYPAQSVFASLWKEIERKELPWQEMLGDTEYYTGKEGLLVHARAKLVELLSSGEALHHFDRVVYEIIRPEWMDAGKPKQ